MNLLIFGASGATGQHLVSKALAQQHRVTAFIRNPAKLSIQHERLTVIQGDVGDESAVQKAVRGHDVVLSALGATSPFRFDPVVVGGMAHIIAAMESAGVPRLIYLSFVGVKDSRSDAGFLIRNVAPVLLRTEIAGHEVRERMIRQSRLRWVIVQAPTLTNGLPKQTYRSGEQLKATAFAPALSRADTADFMLKQVSDDTFLGKSVRLLP